MTISYHSEAVNINGPYTLSGTLTLPDDVGSKHSAILILGGSGNGDRNGNMKKLRTNLYNNLADVLSKNGYMTLRYDKRGVGKSEGCYYETGVSDLIADAISAIRYLKSINNVKIDSIFLLGHSEGALLAPAVYEQENVNGLILLCGSELSGKNLLPQQTQLLIQEINQLTGFKYYLFKILNVQKKVKKQFESILQKSVAYKSRCYSISIC